MHGQLVLVVLHLDAERTHDAERRERVARRAEPADTRHAVAERTDQQCAMRDRLVAGNGDVTDERAGRLDADGAHSAIAGATTTL